MCGIAGFLSFMEADSQLQSARAMTNALAHRGPDDAQVWTDPEAGVALGHRRLAILDLSPLGRQPMRSPCGRFITVFNGEVYNFAELRKELEPLGHAFRGGSDTEVILAAIAQWGLREAVGRFVGMFAIALWDRRERALSLVRDRLGIKPLYYGNVDGRAGGAFAFGSELKALRALPGFNRPISRDALCLYFRHNYIPAPHTIYQGIHKLPPGTILTLRPGEPTPEPEAYWSIREVWTAGEQRPFTGDDAEAEAELERLLGEAISLRMIADVPLGAFLSGGIDSSTVAALMQAQSERPIKTFSIGFQEAQYNEAEHARAVADHLGTEHTELYVTPQDLLDVVPEIPRFWDEPFADSSQIPTYLLCKLTRKHVTVSLSGDGGDELFCGYDRYFWTQRAHGLLSRLPASARRLASGAGRLLPEGFYRLFGPLGPKIRWRLDALRCPDLESLYRYFVSHFKQPERFVLGGMEPGGILEGVPAGDACAWMSLYDLSGYLPDDILTKVDRASMAVSLEARVPLLDHRVVEFAARLPHAMKVRDGQSKWLLRKVLHRHVPRDLVDRPKKGFGVPIQEWLRGDLREWCSDLLSPATLRGQGYVDADFVARMWAEYQRGRTGWHYYLWDVLMFQAWLGSVR